jgi:uncharacterized protein
MRVAVVARITAACAFMASSCRRTPEEFAPQSSLDAAASTLPFAAATGPAPTQTGACPADPEPRAAPLPTSTLTIPDAASGALTIEAEVAKSDHDTQRGLMYRTQMPEMRGMLFELPREDHVFWMHNTCISLDLLYIEHGQIVGIVESAPTLNDEPRRVGKPSEEVLELNGGFCMRHGVNVGQHVIRADAERALGPPTP